MFALSGLLLASNVWSTETGSYAYRALKLYQSGKFYDAMRILKTGLQASQKEADLQGESRIYMGMAQIMIQAYEFETAQKLLDQVRDSELNVTAQLSLVRLRMLWANQQEQYAAASSIFQQNEKLMDQEDVSESVKARVLMERCIADAGQNRACSQDQWETIEDLLDDEAPGLLAFNKGLAADVAKDGENTRKYFQKALEYAQKTSHSWEAGQMLIRLGNSSLAAGDRKAAGDYLLRAAKLYNLLQLDRPFLQAAEAYLALGQDNREIGMAIGEAKARLNPPVSNGP
jgi:hypothetical protein